MHRRWSLSGKLGALGGTLLLVALVSVGLTLWTARQLEGGAAAVNEAGRMRMQTWRIAQTLGSADQQSVAGLAREFDQSIALLRDGDPARPLSVPASPEAQRAFDGIQREWQALRDEWTRGQVRDGAQVAREATTFVEHIDGFVLAIEAELARLASILNAFQFATIAVVIASAITLLYSAYRFVLNPLAQLQAGFARVSAGDLSVRIPTPGGAEFAELSRGFNVMTATLEDLYQNLGDKVREKTLRLEQEHARLQALYETAGLVMQAPSLEALAQGFARKVREVARADAAAVRWSDEGNRRYMLLASDGMPSGWATDESCLLAGDCLCGQPRGEAVIRVIPIASANPTPGLDHCRRGGFETVVSVPVKLQDRMVGEIDLFFRKLVEPEPDDRALLGALANHLAGAVESLRAGALERAKAVSDERGLLASELHDSIAQGLSFMKIQVGLLRQAIEQRDSDRIERSLAELDTGVRDSLSDVRELLVHFRTRANAEDIAQALQTTLRKFEHQSGLQTHLSIEGHDMPLDPEVQVQVLHVVQEALSNVRKHAKAREVWVEVQQAPQWRVEVRDDGCGFDRDMDTPDETHVGMRIMRERAERIGATVEVDTVRGSGTCVVLTLPERQRQAA